MIQWFSLHLRRRSWFQWWRCISPRFGQKSQARVVRFYLCFDTQTHASRITTVWLYGLWFRHDLCFVRSRQNPESGLVHSDGSVSAIVSQCKNELGAAAELPIPDPIKVVRISQKDFKIVVNFILTSCSLPKLWHSTAILVDFSRYTFLSSFCMHATTKFVHVECTYHCFDSTSTGSCPQRTQWRSKGAKSSVPVQVPCRINHSAIFSHSRNFLEVMNHSNDRSLTWHQHFHHQRHIATVAFL